MTHYEHGPGCECVECRRAYGVRRWRGSSEANSILDRVEQRRRMAIGGICPDCGDPMTIDPECQVSDPPHTGVRTAPAALCGTCETCIEL